MMLFTAVPAFAAEQAVVRLELNGHAVDEYYDVWMSGGDVLVPLVRCGRLLGIAVNLSIQEANARFTRPSDGVVCRVSVWPPFFSVGDAAPGLVEPPPVIQDGEMFVPLQVIRTGFGISAQWDYSRQTLALQADFAPAGLAPAEQFEGPEIAGRPNAGVPVNIAFSLVPENKGHRWSLCTEGRIDTTEGTWHFEAGMEGRLGQPELELDMLRIGYQGRAWEFGLGHFQAGLHGLVPGRAAIGGIVGWPDLPDERVPDTGAYWNGEVEPGSMVELFVDGVLYESVAAEFGQFSFTGIPVRLIGLTELKIRVTHPDGSQETLVRNISGVPMAEAPGFGRISAFAGISSGSEPVADREYLLGFDWRQGVSHGVTGRVAFIRESPVENGLFSETDPSYDMLITGAVILFSDRLNSEINLMMNRFAAPGADPAVDYGLLWTTRLGLGRLGLRTTISVYGPDFRLPGNSGPEDPMNIGISGTWTPGGGLALNMDYHLVQPEYGDPFTQWTHQANLWGQWVPASGVRFSLGSRLWMDPLADDSIRGIVSWSGAAIRPLWSLRGDAGWMFSGDGSSLVSQFSAQTFASVQVDANTGFNLSMAGRFGGETLPWAKISGKLAEKLPGGHALEFSAKWESPDLLFANDSNTGAASVAAGAAWSLTKGPGLRGEIGLSMTFLTGDPVELVPALNFDLSGRNPAVWAVNVNLSIRAGQPAVRVGLRFSETLMVFGEGTVPVPSEAGEAGSLVAGVVFRDDNGNGVKDRKEPGVPGIAVRLGARTAITDHQGRYVFAAVPAGRFSLGLSVPELPVEYAPLGGPWTLVIGPEDRVWHAIPVRFWGAVQGRIYMDVDGDGRYGEGDQPVSGVQIFIDGRPSGVYSGDDGSYYLDGLNPGAYELSLGPAELPGDPGRVYSLKVQISPQQPEAIGQDFVITSGW